MLENEVGGGLQGSCDMVNSRGRGLLTACSTVVPESFLMLHFLQETLYPKMQGTAANPPSPAWLPSEWSGQGRSCWGSSILEARKAVPEELRSGHLLSWLAPLESWEGVHADTGIKVVF